MSSENLRPHPMYEHLSQPALPAIPQLEMMLEKSRKVMERAMSRYKPYAIVAMISGGKDSLCAYFTAKKLGIPVTHILHGVTGTGIEETTTFVRNFASTQNVTYLEAQAGEAYEKYVLGKGFFGAGVQAHTFTYHLLKHSPFRREIGKIRAGKRNLNILLLNGARMEESSNRSGNYKVAKIIREESGNIWVNIIHDWRKIDRDAFLEDIGAPINPVTTTLCRSGECMCGTMQSKVEREEASFFFPAWGSWLEDLEHRVRQKGWDWGWGEDKPFSLPSRSQPSYQPLCTDCMNEE